MKRIIIFLMISLFVVSGFCLVSYVGATLPDPGFTIDSSFGNVGIPLFDFNSGLATQKDRESWSLKVENFYIPTFTTDGGSFTITAQISSANLSKSECVYLGLAYVDFIIPTNPNPTNLGIPGSDSGNVFNGILDDSQPVRKECCAGDLPDGTFKGDCERKIPVIIPKGSSEGKLEFELVLYKKDGGAKIDSYVFSVPIVSITEVPEEEEEEEGGGTLSGVNSKSLLELIDRIINVVFWVISSFAFVMIMMGGFMMVTSAGDPSRITKGRNTVFFAIAGFALMSLSRGIVALLQAIFGVKNSG